MHRSAVFSVLLVAAATIDLCSGSPPPPLRVLFVGNSFTFVNDLPHQFANIAESLGKEVVVANSTIGGCTLYHLQPENDKRTKGLLEEEWDFIVLQDYSSLPTVQGARDAYMYPGVEGFVSSKKKAKLVMYLTWGYVDGNAGQCPETDPVPFCFPKGSLANFTSPPCNSSGKWQATVATFPCMGYSLIRGYLSALDHGADMIAPCGVAWQVVRGVTSYPASCKVPIDSEYNSPLPISLPLPTSGALSSLMLYRSLPGGKTDIHPNVAGQYLNALTFFATLFAESPVGAAGPLPTSPDPPLTKQQISTMQTMVADVVLGHKEVWRIQ